MHQPARSKDETPLNIDILGRKWSISFPTLVCDGEALGVSRQDDASIEVEAGLDDHLRRDTLLHEVMHAILRQQGRSYRQRPEEEYVGALATGLITVLDRNPKLRKRLWKDFT